MGQGDTTPDRDSSVAGATAREFVAKMGQALEVLDQRVRLEPAFSPDLEAAKEPLLRALKTVSATAQQKELEAIDAMDDLAASAIDTQMREAGALDLLDVALALGGPGALRTSTIAADGLPVIPGVEIIKEIIEFLKKLFGWDEKWWGKLIDKILEIIDKLLGGRLHGVPTQ